VHLHLGNPNDFNGLDRAAIIDWNLVKDVQGRRESRTLSLDFLRSRTASNSKKIQNYISTDKIQKFICNAQEASNK